MFIQTCMCSKHPGLGWYQFITGNIKEGQCWGVKPSLGVHNKGFLQTQPYLPELFLITFQHRPYTTLPGLFRLPFSVFFTNCPCMPYEFFVPLPALTPWPLYSGSNCVLHSPAVPNWMCFHAFWIFYLHSSWHLLVPCYFLVIWAFFNFTVCKGYLYYGSDNGLGLGIPLWIR